jgi:hypothetical protein
VGRGAGARHRERGHHAGHDLQVEVREMTEQGHDSPFNVLAEHVDAVAPWIADQVLGTTKQGARASCGRTRISP